MTAEANNITVQTNLSSYKGLLEQIAKYMSVGVLNTLIDAVVYFLLTRLIPLFAVYQVAAKVISYAVGMVNSFHWNRKWTFRSNGSISRAVFLFTLTHIAALAVNAGVMGLSLNLLHTPETIAFTLATGASFVWNFALNKMVVFRSPSTT